MHCFTKVYVLNTVLASYKEEGKTAIDRNANAWVVLRRVSSKALSHAGKGCVAWSVWLNCMCGSYV